MSNKGSFFQRLMPRNGLLAGVFSFASSCIGAGILGIPSAFNMSGVILSTVFLAFATYSTIYSMQILAETGQKVGIMTMEDLGSLVFGANGKYFSAVVTWVNCFLADVAYVLSVQLLLKSILSSERITGFFHTPAGLRVGILIIWLLFMLPISLPKSVTVIRYVSLAGVFFMLLFMFFIVYHSIASGLKESANMAMFGSGNTAIKGLPIFIFAYLCQVNTFDVFRQNDPPNIKLLVKQLYWSITLVGLMNWIVGFMGYAEFGPTVNKSILLVYEPLEDPFAFICYVGVLVKICVSFAMRIIPCREAIYVMMSKDVTATPWWMDYIMSSAHAIVALLIGMFFEDINFVFGLKGGICGGLIGFILPAWYQMYAGNFTLQEIGWYRYIMTNFLLYSGVFALVFGTGSAIWGLVTGN